MNSMPIHNPYLLMEDGRTIPLTHKQGDTWAAPKDFMLRKGERYQVIANEEMQKPIPFPPERPNDEQLTSFEELRRMTTADLLIKRVDVTCINVEVHLVSFVTGRPKAPANVLMFGDSIEYPPPGYTCGPEDSEGSYGVMQRPASDAVEKWRTPDALNKLDHREIIDQMLARPTTKGGDA